MNEEERELRKRVKRQVSFENRLALGMQSALDACESNSSALQQLAPHLFRYLRSNELKKHFRAANLDTVNRYSRQVPPSVLSFASAPVKRPRAADQQRAATAYSWLKDETQVVLSGKLTGVFKTSLTRYELYEKYVGSSVTPVSYHLFKKECKRICLHYKASDAVDTFSCTLCLELPALIAELEGQMLQARSHQALQRLQKNVAKLRDDLETHKQTVRNVSDDYFALVERARSGNTTLMIVDFSTGALIGRGTFPVLSVVVLR